LREATTVNKQQRVVSLAVGKKVFIVYTFNLGEALGDQTSFISSNGPIKIILDFIYPMTTDWFVP